MRGFYFTPPPSRLAARSEDSTISNTSMSDSALDDDSRDTYQELELFYVGDGLGAMLEENQEEEKGDLVEDGYDAEEDWASSLKKKSSVNDLEKVKKDLLRRQFYARPKASASFTLM